MSWLQWLQWSRTDSWVDEEFIWRNQSLGCWQPPPQVRPPTPRLPPQCELFSSWETPSCSGPDANAFLTSCNGFSKRFQKQTLSFDPAAVIRVLETHPGPLAERGDVCGMRVRSYKDFASTEVASILVLIGEVWADAGSMPLWLSAASGHRVITSSRCPGALRRERRSDDGGVSHSVVTSFYSNLLLHHMTSLWTDILSSPASLSAPGRSLIPACFLSARSYFAAFTLPGPLWTNQSWSLRFRSLNLLCLLPPAKWHCKYNLWNF